MSDLRALLQEVTENWEDLRGHEWWEDWHRRVRAALSEPLPEPVAEVEVTGVTQPSTEITWLVPLHRFKGKHLLYAVRPTASPSDAIPEGLDFARQRNMGVTDEWLRGWEGARQFAMGNTGPNPCNAPLSTMDDAKDAARYLEALTKIASYREGPVVNSSFDEPESAKIARAAIEREGGA